MGELGRTRLGVEESSRDTNGRDYDRSKKLGIHWHRQDFVSAAHLGCRALGVACGHGHVYRQACPNPQSAFIGKSQASVQWRRLDAIQSHLILDPTARVGIPDASDSDRLAQ